MEKHESFILTVNGKKRNWTGDPTTPLVDVLREDLELCGTKIGCRTGECGACTVLINDQPVTSCLVPAASAENADVQTIEHLRNEELFSELVRAMEETSGVQCGFCTPGIMVTLRAFMQDPDRFGGDVSAALKNNICRCTGYQTIVEAVRKVIGTEVVTK